MILSLKVAVFFRPVTRRGPLPKIDCQQLTNNGRHPANIAAELRRRSLTRLRRGQTIVVSMSGAPTSVAGVPRSALVLVGEDPDIALRNSEQD